MNHIKHIILLAILALAAGTARAWDGSGTSASPYLIKTTADLVALATNSESNDYYGKFFRLENDLNMSGVEIGTIGSESLYFKATFDGNGHAIRNLTINKPDDQYIALFGYIGSSCTVRNLIIDGANITGNAYVAVIVGFNYNTGGTIENCLVVNSNVTRTTSGNAIGIISCVNSSISYSGNLYYNCSVTIDGNTSTTDIATWSYSGDRTGATLATAIALPVGYNMISGDGIDYNGNIYTTDDNTLSDFTIGIIKWSGVQTVLSAASTDADNPTTLTLAADITASGSDSYLDLPYGTHAVLDLNGHTLDRHMTEATADGYVIKVNNAATLTIRDGAGSGGTITGGWNTNGPGCITVYSTATLTLQSGTISGNRVNQQGGSAISGSGTIYISGGSITDNWNNLEGFNTAMGGAIYFTSGGTLYMSGGTVTGNRCGTTTKGAAGIGIYTGSGDPCIHLSGDYDISGNQQGTYNSATGEWTALTPSDVFNSSRTLYVLDDEIRPAAPARMILYTEGSYSGYRATFTSGWATHMGSADPEQCFTLDSGTGLGLGIVGGEAHVGTLHTLTLATGLTATATTDGTPAVAQAAQGKPVTLGGATPSSTSGGITYATDYIVSYNDGTDDQADRYTADADGNATFLMPDADAEVSTEDVCTVVSAVPYIDADGTEQTIAPADITLVSSSYEFGDWYGTATLGVSDYTERWYAVVGTVNVNKQLSVRGNAHIILCDGADLNVNADNSSGSAFYSSPYGLTIYGQAQGTGTLSVTNTGRAIDVESNNTTVNGGTVIATTTGTYNYGIYIIDEYSTLTINRGTVTATGGYGIHINGGTLTQNGGTLSATGSGTNCAGINAQNGARVNILGGTLSATGTDGAYGIRALDDATTVTLGWTDPADRITATTIHLDTSYGTPTLQVAPAQALTDGTALLTGEISGFDSEVTLRPAAAVVFAKEGYGTCYYGDYDLQLPAGMKARIVTSNNSGTLTYETIADGDDDSNNLIPKATAVMLQVAPTESSQTLGLVIEEPVTAAISQDNLLHGSDVATTTDGGAKFYRLSYSSDNSTGLGWYWGADGGAAFESGAHKAWLALELGTTGNARAFFGLPGDGSQTGLGHIEITEITESAAAWYDLNGRRLSSKPTAKGIYVNNGKKIVIK